MDSQHAESVAKLLRMLVLSMLAALAVFALSAQLDRLNSQAELRAAALTALTAGFAALFLEALLPARLANGLDFLTAPARAAVTGLRRPAATDTAVIHRLLRLECDSSTARMRLGLLEAARSATDECFDQLASTVQTIGELIRLQHHDAVVNSPADNDSAITWTAGTKRAKRRAPPAKS